MGDREFCLRFRKKQLNFDNTVEASLLPEEMVELARWRCFCEQTGFPDQ